MPANELFEESLQLLYLLRQSSKPLIEGDSKFDQFNKENIITRGGGHSLI